MAAKTYKIKMKALAVSPTGQYLEGKTYDVSKTMRDQFVNGGYAEDIVDPVKKPAKKVQDEEAKTDES